MQPPASYAPAAMAAGMMLILWGVATAWVVSLFGLVLVGIAARRWLRDFHP